MKGKSRPVGQIFSDPESTVTLQVVEITEPGENFNWCKNCHYARLTIKNCRELQDRFLGECLSFRRNDQKKVIFKKI